MVDILLRRYLWLIKTLRDRGELTYDELAAAWERASLNDDRSVLSKRTLYNHCQAALRHFGVEIICRRGRNLNLYYIANPEIFETDNINRWLLDSLSVNTALIENKDISDKILLESIPKGQSLLPTILEAVKSLNVVSITYQSYKNDKEHVFKIEPYCVKLFRQRWYVIGRNQKHDEIRTYALDRIINVEIIKETFKVPKSFDGIEYFAESFGIISDRTIKPETIKLTVSSHQRNYFYSLPLHHSQQEVCKDDNYSVFEYRLRPTFDFKKEILSYGHEIEILEPEWFRKKIIEDIGLMSNIYKTRLN